MKSRSSQCNETFLVTQNSCKIWQTVRYRRSSRWKGAVAAFKDKQHRNFLKAISYDGGVVGGADVDERALIEHLFERQNYNPLIRPVQNLSQTLEVGFEMALIQLINLVR